jgi:tRNA (guanine10-N2)-methyltransferase
MGQKYRSKNESIRNNLRQYGLENKFLDIMVADFSTKYVRESFKFDAIITDPPYGIREKAKKIGTKKSPKQANDSNNSPPQSTPTSPNTDVSNNETQMSFHSPQQIKYSLGEIYYDLLSFSLEHLNENGRLVYWY